jgi:hypothetical protein
MVYDLTAKSLSHPAGYDRGAMAGAFRQEDVIWPFKDPKGGGIPDALGLRFNCKNGSLLYDLNAKISLKGYLESHQPAWVSGGRGFGPW